MSLKKKSRFYTWTQDEIAGPSSYLLAQNSFASMTAVSMKYKIETRDIQKAIFAKIADICCKRVVFSFRNLGQSILLCKLKTTKI